jgi:DNA primase
MPLISRQSVEEVRQRADFVALAGDYTTLKKAGSSWKGLSPFTSEKTPSFYVHPDKGLFYCFSTTQGGDIFRFLMLKEGLGFQESVERVAQRFGIPLKYEEGGASREERTLRAQLFAVHDSATAFYAAAFREKNTPAATVREYWTRERRFSLDVAEEFKIGFAPVDGGGLAQTLLKEGFAKEALAKSGLFVGMDYSPDPRRWRPRFRGRLVIPIRDIQGRVVAFTARQLALTPADDPAREAKYINSPETEIFHKSQILFNLDKARNAARDSSIPIVLVEGQLDAIRAYSCGVATAVASQGTAIGAEHFALLRRYTRRVDALLDADRAGQAAALKLLPLALRSGFEVRILRVPGGKDPDEYFSHAGAAGWPDVEATAAGAIAFATHALLPPNTPHSPAQKQEALQALFEIIAQAESAVIREDALREVSRLARVDILAMQRDFQRFEQTSRRRFSPSNSASATAATQTPSADSPAAPPALLNSAEETLLVLALHNETLIQPLAEITAPDWVDTSTPAGQLLNRLLAAALEGEWEQGESARHLAETDAERDLLARLLLSHNSNAAPVSDAEETVSAAKNPPRAAWWEDPAPDLVNECLGALFKRFANKRRAEIAAAITALPPGDFAPLQRLQKEDISLRQKLKSPPRLPSSPDA